VGLRSNYAQLSGKASTVFHGSRIHRFSSEQEGDEICSVAPDATTVEHYTLAVKAIQAKSQPDAQAAFYLLRSDVMRMRTNTLDVQAALAILYSVSNAVDKEDWTTAEGGALVLQATYGKH
jgi:hypothetical protein